MFSTTTVPSRGFILSAHGRPMASNAPPGANGTTSRIGRVGYFCATAVREMAGSAAPLAARCKNVRAGKFHDGPQALSREPARSANNEAGSPPGSSAVPLANVPGFGTSPVAALQQILH